MRRDSKLVRGLVEWLIGPIAARLDFVEQDVEALRKDSQQLKQQVEYQGRQMIALRKIHALLAGKVDREFPGRQCEECGSALIFRREASRNVYLLKCPNGCGKALIVPEALLLNTMRQLPPAEG